MISGSFPSTLADDGDPLDVLVFLDAPAVVGCVMAIRLIGVIEAEQRKSGQDWIRNDRLLAVATHAHTREQVHTLDDLRPHLLDEIEGFFQQYNEFKGVEFKPARRGNPRQAHALVDQAETRFREAGRAGK